MPQKDLTPLGLITDCLVTWGADKVVRMLIVAGADKSLKNKDTKNGPKTAKELAKEARENMRSKSLHEQNTGSKFSDHQVDSAASGANGAHEAAVQTSKGSPSQGLDISTWDRCIQSLEMSAEEIRAEDWKEAQEYDSVCCSQKCQHRHEF